MNLETELAQLLVQFINSLLNSCDEVLGLAPLVHVVSRGTIDLVVANPRREVLRSRDGPRYVAVVASGPLK